MTVRTVVSCDGHRNGMACRGYFVSRYSGFVLAPIDAANSGWRKFRDLNLCPSPNHTEEGLDGPV